MYRLRVVDVADQTTILASTMVNVSHARVGKNGRKSIGLHFEEVGIFSECIPFEGGGTTMQIGSICPML